MSDALIVTHHARHRGAQRNLSADDIAFVLQHGRRIWSGGAEHVFLARRDLPPERDLRRQFERLEGTVLVVDNVHDGTVLITAYRNRRALKHIRCKTKYARAV
mgnify:CR=1 FL=1